jgi:PKD repeat protein
MEYISWTRVIVLSIAAMMVFSCFISSNCLSLNKTSSDITYDVYFGTSIPTPKVVSNQTSTEYDPPGLLEYNTTYYWQIVAWDDQGNSASGPVWHFTTENMNQPPVAIANGPPVADKKVPVVFDGSESYDPDGFIVNWSWDFGDSLQGFGEVVEHTYMNSGEYPVTLEVEDDDGATDDDQISISIINHAPFAIINGPSYGYVGEPLIFDGSASYDPDGDSLTYEWDFGDSTPNEYDAVVEHVFNFPGIFIVSLIVEDDDLNDPRMDMDTLEVEIIEPNVPPIAEAGPDQWVWVLEVVTFDGSASYDPDGTIVNWTWDFGTGDIGYGEIVEYMYYYDGEFQVMLTVRDDDGATDNDTCTVYVEPYIIGTLSEKKSPVSIARSQNSKSLVIMLPKPPSDPYPENGATDVLVDVILSWTGGSMDLEVDFSGGFGVTVTFTNIGDGEVENINLSLFISGGILNLINVTIEDTFSIPVNEPVSFSSGPFVGFGSIEVALTINEFNPLTIKGFQFVIFTVVL